MFEITAKHVFGVELINIGGGFVDFARLMQEPCCAAKLESGYGTDAI